MIKRFTVMALFSVWLAGCTDFALRELRHTEPVDSPFHATLSKLYLDFAENEAIQYDWISSQHFANKGLLAAYGNNIEPEDPADWNIPDYALEQAEEARQMLEDHSTAEGYARAPEKLAQMYFYYDCWLEQLEEAWQNTDIELCREQFVALADEISHVEETPQPVYADEENPQGGPFIAPVITSDSYLLFFPWDADEIAAGQARLELDVMLDDLRENPDTDIIINGHADRSGSDDYNLDLSHSRAQFVRAALLAEGIDESRIQYFAFGESDPQISTADGVRERANRRVEVFIE